MFFLQDLVIIREFVRPPKPWNPYVKRCPLWKFFTALTAPEKKKTPGFQKGKGDFFSKELTHLFNLLFFVFLLGLSAIFVFEPECFFDSDKNLVLGG